MAHKIVIKKLEKYGIKHEFIDWFKTYINSRKHYVRYTEGTTPSEEIIYICYCNDLQHETKLLDPIMFTDDTYLFYSNSNINELFENVNKELSNVTDWRFLNTS